MKKQLQIAKITPHGRIYLGKETMARLNARIGDHIQIVEEGDILKIAKVEA